MSRIFRHRLPRHLLMGSTLFLACCSEDDDHKGNISHGPAATRSAEADKAAPWTRLVIQPGSPVATMRVHGVLLKRLAHLKLMSHQVAIVGDEVHVEVGPKQLPAARKALAGERLDVALFDEAAKSTTGQLPPPLSRAKEQVHGHQTAFLVAPAAHRSLLKKQLEKALSAHAALLGPWPFGKPEKLGWRSYAIRSDKRIRGEFVHAASAETTQGSTKLVLVFEAFGTSFLRWHSKHGGRFLVEVDGEVIGIADPSKPVDDGVLRVRLVAGRDDLKEAQLLASKLHGRALSHLVSQTTALTIPAPAH